MSQAGNLNSGGVIPPGTYVETLTGNSGGAVSPNGSGNINTLGAGSITIAGNPGTNTTTTELTGITQHSLQVGGSGGNALTQLGVATNGQLPIGSTGTDPVLATIGSGNNITVSNGAGSISVAVTGTSNHQLQIGNASGSLTSLGAATNGQIPIGSTGVDPVLSTLTAGTGITITNGAGSITIATSGTTTLTYTNVNTSPYVVLSTDEYLSVDCSGGPITLQFPNAATASRAYIVKDRTGSAAINNITVTTVGGAVNIDGASTLVMNTIYEAINIIGNGSTYEVY